MVTFIAARRVLSYLNPVCLTLVFPAYMGNFAPRVVLRWYVTLSNRILAANLLEPLVSNLEVVGKWRLVQPKPTPA